MRSIPAEILNRIKDYYQTKHNNAEPKMKILISRGFNNELFRVYTIHNNDGLERLDTTARRRQASAEPDLAYSVYIRNGVAHVISKPLPYDEMTPWDYEFQLGSASDVAIEFNGYWERDQVSKRFNFIADEYPWIFRQNSGSLTAQYWNESSLELATGVGRICALRGWFPAQEGFEADQGLIVAYIRGGNIYYRNYCEQPNGVSYIWETERLVAELNHGDYTDLALFRTNDFRVGFVAKRSNGQIWYAVTIRNYAGMSLFPEILKTTATATFTFHEIEKLEGFNAEILETTATLPMASYCAISDLDIELLESAVRQADGYEILLTFAYPLQEHEGFESNFSVSGESIAVTSTEQGGNSRQLILNVDVPLAQTADYVLSYTMYPDYLILAVNSHCNPPMEEFVVDLWGTPPVVEETLNVTATAEFTYTEIDHVTGHNNEILEVTATAEFVLRNLDGDPV